MATYTSIMEDMMELQEMLVLENFQWEMAEAQSEDNKTFASL